MGAPSQSPVLHAEFETVPPVVTPPPPLRVLYLFAGSEREADVGSHLIALLRDRAPDLSVVVEALDILRRRGASLLDTPAEISFPLKEAGG